MLYIFIFVIIQLEDLALLIGSIGVFIILGLVMYFSRKIDWYNLTAEKATTQRDQIS
jgi:inner membrane protein